jgi:hypothetical protein
MGWLTALFSIFRMFESTPKQTYRHPGMYKCNHCGGFLSQGEKQWVSAGAASRCEHEWAKHEEKPH